MGILSNILDLIFPPKCIFCGKILSNTTAGVCDSCQKDLPYTKGSQISQTGNYFDVCVSPLYYKDNVRKSILRFKFKGAVASADYYGKLIAACVRAELSGKYDMITWVPLSAERAKTRGYDQAMLLALAVALELDDVAVETLTKTQNIQAQSDIHDRDQRRANVSGVYALTDPELIIGKRVLMIDDVITTGATLSECARTLLLGGADAVVCATLARTPLSHEK